MGVTLGHIKLFRIALSQSDVLVVLLGSAFHARTPKNPFTWIERKNMVLAGLTPEERERVLFVPIRDYHDNVRWSRVAYHKVTQLVGRDAEVRVFGHYKDASSSYLSDCFPQWTVVSVPSQGNYDATTVRAMLFSGEDPEITVSALEEHVPAGVRQYLKVWMQQPCFEDLKEQFKVLAEERKKYGIGPFVAGDGIYRTKTHVLLIRRKNHPGKDLWAVPGGFLESSRRETTRQCAEREGTEETKLGVLKTTLDAAYRSSAVFDHPDRSVRGNVVSFAYFYDFNTDSQPEVEAGDDAKKAEWVLIADLPSMEEEFFDDHYPMLKHFIPEIPLDEDELAAAAAA
jgi:bifunctional NMN adenylyltransferase/nudix hydrolase